MQEDWEWSDWQGKNVLGVVQKICVQIGGRGGGVLQNDTECHSGGRGGIRV
jgi:hypothetical protein